MAGKRGRAHSGYLGRMPVLDLPDWMADGVCVTSGRPADFWFPADEDGPGIRAAVVACRGCPVRGLCLDRALRLGELHHGIVGGMTPAERRALARETAA